MALPVYAGRELFVRARTKIPQPLAGQALRYDVRGTFLAERRDVPAAITAATTCRYSRPYF